MTDARTTTRALVVTLGAVALAVLSWMSAADRMAADAPQPGKIYFGGYAAAQAAFEELAQQNPQAALRLAQRAVRTAPIEPSATSALGSALLTLGRPDQAYNAFVVAGQLGWRDIPTQLYWLTQAVAAGDVGIVAERLDALLRLNINNDAVARSLDLLERTEPGRNALAKLLLENPPWQSRFLMETGSLDAEDFDGRMAAIDLAAAKGAPIDCNAVGVAANRLISRGQIDAAKELWRRACDRSGDLYLSDGTFEAAAGKVSTNPFNWRLQARAGLDVDVVSAPPPLKGHALRIASSMTVRALAARQLEALRPGRYRLSWQTARADGKPDDSITVLVDCNGTTTVDVEQTPAPAGAPNQTAKIFSIPAQGCPIQAIDIQKAASNGGDTETGWLDNVSIVPLDQHNG